MIATNELALISLLPLPVSHHTRFSEKGRSTPAATNFWLEQVSKSPTGIHLLLRLQHLSLLIM